MILAVPAAVPARAADARLESAREQREAVQERLAVVQQRLDTLQSEVAQVEDRVAELQRAAKAHRASARQADAVLHARIVDAYKRGEVPAALSLLGDGALDEVAERARLLTVLALRDRARSESAISARIRARATAAEVAKALDVLDERRAELDTARRDVAAALEEAKAHEATVERTIAMEAAARERAARQRAARQASTTSTVAVAASGGGSAASGGSTAGAGGGAPVSGGIACPVGSPRSYSDTWGAPRSGGRSHMGTDIMAPRGTPSYAYESGVITRMNSSSLGGISLYFQGDSGNLYYYTHLNGYAAGSAPGKRVSAGALIAYVGDTGNARGMPHLHFEVMPGGGSNVNPYPYVYRACG